MPDIAYIKLSQLNGKIRDTIQKEFSDSTCWVVADITDHSFNPKKNHHYFELVEKGLGPNQILARISGTAWSQGADNIKDFERITGQRFTDNISVLVNVSVKYHMEYGLKLEVNQVDPDGKKVQSTTNKDGTISLSSNAPSDVKRAAGLLQQTSVGREELGNALASDHEVTITINTKEVNNDNGVFKTGVTHTTSDSKGIIKTDVVVYEATVQAQMDYVTDRGSIPVGDKNYKASDLKSDDVLGSAMVHELTHATDPKSNSSINKNTEETEKKPIENQQKHLDEIITKKQQ